MPPVSSIASAWNPYLKRRSDSNWSSFDIGRTGAGAAAEAAGDSVSGVGGVGVHGSGALAEAGQDVATGSGTVTGGATTIMEWSNKTVATPLSLYGNAQINSGALAYPGHTNYLRLDYLAGTAGVTSGVQATINSYALKECYIEFSARIQRYLNCKWLKFHGIQDGGGRYSNTTFSVFDSANDQRVWHLHGPSPTGSNDTGYIVKSDGTWAANGVPAVSSPVYDAVSSVVVERDDQWHDYRFHIKFSTAAEVDGIVEGWRKEAGVWVLKYRIRGLVNAQDNNPGIQRITLGDYSNGSQTQNAYMLVDNVIISSGGWTS